MQRGLPYAPVVRTAFKEWAAVVDALARGEQILILRKGGIAEGKGGFQLEHERFLLYPTHFHNPHDSVIASAQGRLSEIAGASSPPDQVRIEFAAEVVEARKLDSLADAERLRGQHVWRDEVIARRFDWGRDKRIHALALRVYRVARARILPIIPAYAGCKSWIELEVDFDLDPAMPVLDEAAFGRKLQSFRAALAAPIAA